MTVYYRCDGCESPIEGTPRPALVRSARLPTGLWLSVEIYATPTEAEDRGRHFCSDCLLLVARAPEPG